jgi:hypothetical protein
MATDSESGPAGEAARESSIDRTPDTVTEALALLTRQGYSASFQLVDGMLSCGEASCPVDQAVVERVYRFEGPSDPGDEMIVFGVLEPASGVRGTVAAPFGPLADPTLYQHLSGLHDRFS